MAVIQIPADLPIELVQGDELSFALQFNDDREDDYTWQSGVYNASLVNPTNVFSPALEIDVETDTPEEGDPVTTTTVIVSFTETQTQLLTPRQNWRWFIRWVAPGGVTRTIISGQISSRAP
ncbi:MAG: hypothetical protein KGR24_05940 [Planctomycetes bacterium]|nr:hypothetical protein [Planctomycetota bacterium]